MYRSSHSDSNMLNVALIIGCARRSVANPQLMRSCLAKASYPSTAAKSPTLLFAKAASTEAGSSLLLRHAEELVGITTLTLNNPKKYNVLSWEMLDTVQNQLDDIAADSSIRVLVVGANGKAFSSGHDLKEIQSYKSLDVTTELFNKCSRVMISLNKMPQPVIAKVQGVATAAGCQLAASCDLAIGSSEARFGVSGINLGLFCSTPAVAVSRAVPRKQALHMLLTGDLISAEKALSYGLLNKVVSPNLLDVETMKLAQQIANQSSFGVQLGKKMFYDQLAYDSLEDAYDYAIERITCNLQHPDAKQGIDDFVKKRK